MLTFENSCLFYFPLLVIYIILICIEYIFRQCTFVQQVTEEQNLYYLWTDWNSGISKQTKQPDIMKQVGTAGFVFYRCEAQLSRTCVLHNHPTQEHAAVSTKPARNLQLFLKSNCCETGSVEDSRMLFLSSSSVFPSPPP